MAHVRVFVNVGPYADVQLSHNAWIQAWMQGPNPRTEADAGFDGHV